MTDSDPHATTRRGALSRLVRAGIRDVEQRLAWVNDRSGADDDAIAAVFEGSFPARWTVGISVRVRAAARTSVLVQIAGRVAETWSCAGMLARRRLTGVVLVVAVATHLILQVAQAPPAGWLWLILPGLAASIGALLLLASAGAEPGAGP